MLIHFIDYSHISSAEKCSCQKSPRGPFVSRNLYFRSRPLRLPQFAIAMYHQRSRELVKPPILVHVTSNVPTPSRLNDNGAGMLRRSRIEGDPIDAAGAGANICSTSSRYAVSLSSRFSIDERLPP